MSYCVLVFEGGPWDGQKVELEKEPEPCKMTVSVASPVRGPDRPWAYENWTYEGGRVEAGAIVMVGRLDKRSGG